jgi:hypothetical protein
MNILLNNLITLSAQARVSPYYIVSCTGLGISDIRTSSFVFSGRDGGLITDQFFDLRNINISGKISSASKLQHQIDRQALINALPVGSTFPVYFTMFDGTTYRTLSMLAGDVVVIDMANRTVKLNGSSIMGNKTSDSTWWGLQPGNNPVVLNSDSAGDAVTGVLVWRNGVRGI